MNEAVILNVGSSLDLGCNDSSRDAANPFVLIGLTNHGRSCPRFSEMDGMALAESTRPVRWKVTILRLSSGEIWQARITILRPATRGIRTLIFVLRSRSRTRNSYASR